MYIAGDVLQAYMYYIFWIFGNGLRCWELWDIFQIFQVFYGTFFSAFFLFIFRNDYLSFGIVGFSTYHKKFNNKNKNKKMQ